MREQFVNVGTQPGAMHPLRALAPSQTHAQPLERPSVVVMMDA